MSKRKPSNKNVLPFDFESFDTSEEITPQMQSLHALRVIGLIQIGYVVIGYTIGITSTMSQSKDITAIIQAPGGVSILSAVAALLIRLDCSAQQSKTQLLAYTILVGLDLLGWLLRIILTLHTIITQSLITEKSIIELSPFGFVLILSIMGLMEARALKSLVETTRYAPLNTLVSDGEIHGYNKTFTELCYYPLRRVCGLQLAYWGLIGVVRVIGAIVLHSMGTLEFLINPSLGVFTPLAAVSVLAYCFPPERMTRVYGILIGLDAVTGVIRMVIGFVFGAALYTLPAETKNAYFVTATLWSLFIFYLWGIGIYETRNANKYIVEHSDMSSQVDHIFSL